MTKDGIANVLPIPNSGYRPHDKANKNICLVYINVIIYGIAGTM